MGYCRSLNNDVKQKDGNAIVAYGEEELVNLLRKYLLG